MTTPTEVDLTQYDLNLLSDQARKHWMETDVLMKLPAVVDPLTPIEFQALAWFRAVSGLLAARGWAPGVVPRLVASDSEPQTEDL